MLPPFPPPDPEPNCIVGAEGRSNDDDDDDDDDASEVDRESDGTVIDDDDEYEKEEEDEGLLELLFKLLFDPIGLPGANATT